MPVLITLVILCLKVTVTPVVESEENQRVGLKVLRREVEEVIRRIVVQVSPLTTLGPAHPPRREGDTHGHDHQARTGAGPGPELEHQIPVDIKESRKVNGGTVTPQLLPRAPTRKAKIVESGPPVQDLKRQHVARHGALMRSPVTAGKTDQRLPNNVWRKKDPEETHLVDGDIMTNILLRIQIVT